MTRESEGRGLSERLRERADDYFDNPRYSIGIQLNGTAAGVHASLLREAASHIEHLEESLARADELAERIIVHTNGKTHRCPDCESRARAYLATRNPKEEG